MTARAAVVPGLAELGERLGRPVAELQVEVNACLAEMTARHSRVPMQVWGQLGRWLLRGQQLTVDRDALDELRRLDERHTLVWLPSHRSYLDAWALPQALDACGFPPYYVIGGANLDFWPFGDLARRTGLVFIRRDVRDDPVYRFALRWYLRQLVRAKADFGWSIEGGRTRTGKLRPPRYGVLRYLSDAVVAEGSRDVLLVPVSIVYDQLQEVPSMIAEARGAGKRPEDLRWLAEFAMRQGDSKGRMHIDFGEPLALADRLEELELEPGAAEHAVERVALEVCHRINRVTPVVGSAVVTLALLAADRALTLDELVGAVAPMARYIERRELRVACDADLTDRALLEDTLSELERAGVVVAFAGGRDPVWSIGRDQHLVAAFYRNSAAHFLVNRAIAELVRDRVGTEETQAALDAGAGEALRLRDLLKFEFFFARKREFLSQVHAEIDLLRNDDDGLATAPLVLRPFLEAYLVVATELAEQDPRSALQEEPFLGRCLEVGRQWHLQRRIHSSESVSLEVFRTAVRLIRHRGLWSPEEPDLAARRRAFAREIADTVVTTKHAGRSIGDRPYTPSGHAVRSAQVADIPG